MSTRFRYERAILRWLFVVEWPRRLTVLAVALFLHQYAVWFSDYWWKETAAVVKGVLLAAVLVEWIPRLHPALRRTVQFIAVLAAHYIALGVTPFFEKINSFDALVRLLKLNAAPFNPFIWYGLGAWLVFLFTIWATRSKAGIYTMVLGSIATFSIVDSFSRYVFWDQVAFLILSGLVMLIVHHFDQLREKHPNTWAYLIEYPGSVMAPVAVLLAVIMAAGVLAPNVRPLITDPYTAWKTWKGEPVLTGGKGLTKIFENIGVSASGYGRDDSSLGGGFNFDYTPVMRVSTSKASYYRGETKSFYTGKGWLEITDMGNPSEEPVTIGADLSTNGLLNSSRMQTESVTQRITMASDEAYNVIFGAKTIAQIQSVDGQGDGKLPITAWDPVGEQLNWMNVSDGLYPNSYTVVSQVPIIEEDMLRTAPPSAIEHAYMRIYHQLPGSVPERVFELAREITGVADNSYDKAKLLESYLRENYPYTNKPDTSLASSDDFVDSFLFEVKEGYCDYFSTALVVLARAAGLPARWVKGYTSGQQPNDELRYSFQEREFDPLGPGIYTVRNADAHSWTEIYFEGFGWIPFEPTSGFTMPRVVPRDQQTAPEAVETTAPEGTQAEGGRSAWMRPAAAGSIALIVAAAVFWLAVRRLKKGFGWRSLFSTHPQKPDTKRLIIREFERFVKFSRRKGYVRSEHETVKETISRWSDENRWLENDLHRLYALFERAKYSQSILSHDDVELAAKAVRRLREEM